MTIHFAPAVPAANPHFARWLRRPMVLPADNDNAGEAGDDTVLRDALEHFARHGLGAAEQARASAEQAILAEDLNTYRHWLGICRALDRRMAAKLERSHG